MYMKMIEYFSDHQWLLIVIVFWAILFSMVSNRSINKGYLILYLIFLIYITLACRTPKNNRGAWLQIFHTYREFFSNTYLRREILNNIFLFIPLGAILFRLRSKRSTLLIIVLLSSAIELLQLITQRGLFETDDIISNSLGGFIGIAACMLWTHVCRKRRLC